MEISKGRGCAGFLYTLWGRGIYYDLGADEVGGTADVLEVVAETITDDIDPDF